MHYFSFIFTIALICCSCNQEFKSISGLGEEVINQYADTSIEVYEPLAVLKLPLSDGVTVWNPGILTKGPEGRIFGANMTGEIYSLIDTNGDGLEDKALEFCNVKDDGFRTPGGLAFKGWDLYVGLPQEIRVYRDLNHDFQADTSFVFFDEIPFSDHPYEYTSGLIFDNNGWLYFALSTDSWNAGASPDPKKYRGSILRVSPDGKKVEQLATGIRSVPGMTFDSKDQLYFVDNQGGQNPIEELHVLKEGSFYGHNTIKYGERSEITALKSLTTEVAPAEIEFVTEESKEFLYVAFYGPGEYWQRGAIARLALENGKLVTDSAREVILTNIPKSAGLAVSDQGDLYVSSVGVTDYWYFATERPDGAIYRITRAPWVVPTVRQDKADHISAAEDVLEKGRFIFASRACASCHSRDGVTELLGPDLKNIGQIYNKGELIEEISQPSKRIKPGSFATKITTRDDEVYLGRVVSQDAEEVSIMLIGNIVKKIAVSKIMSSETQQESMMYEGLLEGLDSTEVDALITFLVTEDQDQ